VRELVWFPAVGTPAVGTPAVGTPAVGTPAVGTPAVGTPAVGTPAVGTPAVGTLAVGGPAVGGPVLLLWSGPQCWTLAEPRPGQTAAGQHESTSLHSYSFNSTSTSARYPERWALCVLSVYLYYVLCILNK